MAINFRGYLFQDDGDAVNGATVQLLETGTTTVEASTTTDSNGLWYFNEGDQDRYDVKITSGTSVRYIRWDDQISLKEIDIRNNTGNTTPAATFTNLINNASNQVAVFSGANTTRADGDEIYLSFKLANSAGDIEEFARITAEAVDVTDGAEDGQLRFGVAKTNGTITDVFTINSTTGGETSMTFDVSGDLSLDADGGDIFFKDDGTTFGSATNNSGNLILKSGTTTAATFSGANVTFAGTVDATTDFTIGDTVITDGVVTDSTGLQLAANLDINGTADISGDLTLSGGADGALQFTNAGENSIKIPDNQASALIIEEADNAYITFVTSNGSEAITVAKATTFSAGIADSGTIAAGTWEGTDVAVAHGGTGASSLTDGGVLLGSGTNAVTAMAVLADGEMIVGDGTTDPVAESGATLRTSIGVGTGNDVEFAAITGTTIDATTDFTIGTTVITDDSIVMTPSTSDTITIAGATNGALNITTVDNDAAAANIQITADGTAELAGTTVTLDSAGDIELEATNDINVPTDVGITFGDDGEKIEGDGSHLTIASSNQLKLNSTNEIHTISGDLFLDIAGGDIYLRDSSPTTMARISHVSSDLVIQSTVQDKDIIFKQNDGGSEGDVTALTLDGSAAGSAIFGAGTAAQSVEGATPQVQIHGSSSSSTRLVIGSFQNNGNEGRMQFLKSRNTTIGSSTIVQDGDNLGQITFCADDGTDYISVGARIIASIDGTPGANDTPGRLVFHTTPDGSQGTTERMRITSAGLVGIGATAPDHLLTLANSAATSQIELRGGGTAGGGVFFSNYGNQSGVMSTGVRVNGGSWTADTTASGGAGASAIYLQSGSSHVWYSNSGTTDGNNISLASSQVFNIAVSGDVVGTHGTYHESSDVRLKENITTIPDALNKVESLRGVNFTWKDTENKGSNLRMGFIAQEVEEVIPEVVHTQNDERKTKAVEHQYITGLLVEAIKELSNKVKDLEAK